MKWEEKTPLSTVKKILQKLRQVARNVVQQLRLVRKFQIFAENFQHQQYIESSCYDRYRLWQKHISTHDLHISQWGLYIIIPLKKSKEAERKNARKWNQ